MIAVGALHESIASRCARDSSAAAQQQLFSIRQYNKAIQQLTGEKAQTLPKGIILTSCILFIIFENLYGRNNEAAKHLKSGIAMLKSWKPTTSSEMVVKNEYLTPIYTRGYIHEASVNWPTAFDNVEAARRHLQMLLDSIYSSVDSAMVSEQKGAVSAKVSHAQSLLQKWYRRFTRLSDLKNNERQRAKILLRLQFETATILLAAVLLDDECGFDRYIDTFRVIVDQCEQLVALESILMGRNAMSSEAFTYGFDLNILPPLNITAFKCREPNIRRRAIALLNAGNRYEGLWNGKTVARIAQRTLEIEEAGLAKVVVCTDIPRCNRIRLVALTYNPGNPNSSGRYGGSRSSADSHYSLDWSRNILNGEPLEKVSAYLPVSTEERSCSWGPGRFPWHMVFQYDPEWAQWKMSFSPQDPPRAKVGTITKPGSPEATKPSTPAQSPSRSATSSSASRWLHDRTTEHDTASSAETEQQINLFWDHWRLRQMPLRGSSTTAVEIEKEAARGGRSYGDAHATETSEMHPSHLLISLP